MPRVIDNRVVEMEFDNSNFERNVGTSLSTLDKLKAALSFKGTDKDFSIVETSVMELGKSFSWLEQIGIGMFRKLGESIEGWAEKTVKNLSGVQNAIDGFTRFGNITKATGTLKGQGYALDEIEKQLDRLNWFTDETSYNLGDMVENISKFTASGMKLDESTDAMMGIALWAATAGQNAGTASRAMYQLSQALSAGYMRKEDWKSIQNASMDTRIFRQHTLDAAVALKTLKKNADGTYTSLVAEGKAGKEAFTIDQFTERLTEGAWFTKDVMMSVYREYAGGVEEIYKYMEKYGVRASDAVEALRGKVSDFALDAFLAGQEARTWADVIGSVQDASATAWMNIYQDLFGDYESVVKFFTNLANQFYDIFVEPINGLNDVLEKWGEKGGQSAFIQSIYNIVNAIENFAWVFKHVFDKIVFGTTKKDEIFGIKVDRLLKITDAVKNFTEQLSNTIRHSLVFRRYLRAFLTIFDMAWQVVSGFYRAVKDTFSGVGNVLKSVIEKLSYVVREFYYLGKRTKKNDTFFKFFSTALKPIKNLKERITNLYREVLPKLTERWNAFKEKAKEKLESPFEKLKESLKSLGNTLKNAWSGLFGGGTAETDAQKFWSAWEKVKQTFYDITGMEPGTFIDHVANGIGKLTEKVQKLNSWLTEKDAETGVSGIEKIQNAYESAVKWIKDNLGPIWTDVTGSLGSVFQWIKENWNSIWDTINKVGSAIWSFLSGLWESVSSIFSKGEGEDTGESAFTGLLDSLKTLGRLLGTVLGSIVSAITPLVDNIKNTLGDLSLDNAGEFLKGGGIALLGAGFLQWSRNFKKSNWISGFGNLLDGLAGPLDSFAHMLDGKALKEAAIGIGILVGSLLLLVSMPQDDMLGAALTMSMILDVLIHSLKKLSGFSTTAKINKEGFNFTKTGAGSTILMLAVSMVAIALALRMIAKIPEDDLYRAAFVIGILIYVVGFAIKSIVKIQNSGNKGLIGGSGNTSVAFNAKAKTGLAGTLIGLAAFIGVVVIALQKISDMVSKNPKGFYIALAAVAGIMLALGIFLNSVSKTYKMTEMGRSVAATANEGFWKDILALGAAIYLVALAFEKIATASATGNRMLGAGLLIMAIMGIMIGFVKVAGSVDGSKVAGAAGGLLLFSVAIGLVAGIFAILAKVLDTVKDMKRIYIAFGMIGAVFLIFTALFAGKWGEKIDAKKMVKAAAAMIILSVAIGIAAGSMLLLAQIPAEKLRQVEELFVIIVLAFAALGILASTSVGNGFVKLGKTFILIAGGVALLGAGFLMAAEAIKLFSDESLDIDRAADNISKLIDKLLEKLPEWASKITEMLIDILLSGIPATINAFVDTISNVLAGLIEKDTITGKMKIQTIVENAIDVLVAVCDTIALRAKDIVESVGGMILSLVTELNTWLINNAEDIGDAITGGLEAIIGVILSIFDSIGEKIFGVDQWEDIKKDLKEAWEDIKDTIHDVVEDIVEDIMGIVSAIQTVLEVLGIASGKTGDASKQNEYYERSKAIAKLVDNVPWIGKLLPGGKHVLEDFNDNFWWMLRTSPNSEPVPGTTSSENYKTNPGRVQSNIGTGGMIAGKTQNKFYAPVNRRLSGPGQFQQMDANVDIGTVELSSDTLNAILNAIQSAKSANTSGPSVKTTQNTIVLNNPPGKTAIEQYRQAKAGLTRINMAQ